MESLEDSSAFSLLETSNVGFFEDSLAEIAQATAELDVLENVTMKKMFDSVRQTIKDIDELKTKSEKKLADETKSLNELEKELELEDRKLESLRSIKIQQEVHNRHLQEEAAAINSRPVPTLEEIQMVEEEAVELEIAREVRRTKALDRRECILSLMAYYKRHLDCYVEHVGQTEFVFYFHEPTNKETMPGCWVRMLALDEMFGKWEILEINGGNPEENNKLIDEYERTQDIMRFLSGARKLLIK